VKPHQQPVEDSAQSWIIGEFQRYLLQERGLSPLTLLNYVPVVEQFLAERFHNSAPNFAKLLATHVTGFVMRHAHQLSPVRAGLMITALRSFFRFLRHRDHAFLLTPVQTGRRLSEMTALRHEDVWLAAGAHVHCRGKGRKERCTPLAKPTVAVLKAWIREQSREDSKTLFPSIRGGPLSADGVQHLLARHVAQARKNCASLRKKRVSPHVLRHAAAMELLQAGVDRAVIALWLGHESVETTQIYLDADLALKEQALAKTNAVKGAPKRYQPDDELLAFLKQL
jgi:site-specific recombinase XerD